MHAAYQLKPDELNESFLQAIKKQFKNQTVEIAVSDVPAAEAANNEPRKAGALKGRIKMSDDFNAPFWRWHFQDYIP
jgi:hypothetical protein